MKIFPSSMFAPQWRVNNPIIKDKRLSIFNNKLVQKSALLLLAIACILFVVAPFYGIIPLNNVNSLGIMFTALGNINCLTKMELCTPCAFVGLPLGGYMPFGLSYAYVSSVIQIISKVSVVNAYNLTGLLFLFLGWVGMFLTIRSFGGNRFFSFAGGFLFLFMPIVWAKSGYVFMMWAFASLPFFIWLDLWYFQTKRLIVGFPVVLLSKIFLIFLEPYTFVMASMFTGAIMLYKGIKAFNGKSSIYKPLISIFFIAVTPIIAYLLYKNYIPEGANYSVMPLDFFRGQGIDLVSFFNRPDKMYVLGQFWPVSIPNSRLFYSDGESVSHVYFGVGLLLVLPLLFYFRRKIALKHWIFFTVGVVTLFLSFGPSLKINNQRNRAEITTENITFDDYLMPEASATLSLPHSLIYKIPPIKYMRSVSRWFLPTVMVFVVLLMVLLTLLWNRGWRGRIIALLFTVLIVVEYAPSYNRRLEQINYTTGCFNAFNSTALEGFRGGVKQDDLVFFIQLGGLSNGYFSTYLCADVECRSYNVSSDKAVDLSMKQWPAELQEVAINPKIDAMVALLKARVVTVFVFPHFDMRWDSYSWPPVEDTKSRFAGFAKNFDNGKGEIVFQSNEWFSFLRLKE